MRTNSGRESQFSGNLRKSVDQFEKRTPQLKLDNVNLRSAPNTMSSSNCAKLLWASADPRAQSSLSFTTSSNSPVVLIAIVISCCFKSHFGPQGLSSHPSLEANKAPPSYYNPTCGPFTHIRGRQSGRWQKVAQSFGTTSLSASWSGRPAPD